MFTFDIVTRTSLSLSEEDLRPWLAMQPDSERKTKALAVLGERDRLADELRQLLQTWDQMALVSAPAEPVPATTDSNVPLVEQAVRILRELGPMTAEDIGVLMNRTGPEVARLFLYRVRTGKVLSYRSRNRRFYALPK